MEVDGVDEVEPPTPVEGKDKQMPAVIGVVLVLAQQLQEVQPVTKVAEEEQQQPPKHKLVPQSKFVEHTSPGELRTQEPPIMEQEVQFARVAEDEQQ